MHAISTFCSQMSREAIAFVNNICDRHLHCCQAFDADAALLLFLSSVPRAVQRQCMCVALMTKDGMRS